MPAGLQVINASGIIQIDELYRGMVLRKAVTLGAGLNAVSFANAISPIIALRSTASPGMCVKSVTPGSTYTWNVFGAGVAYIFDVLPAALTTGAGLQVFTAAGELAFDSSYEQMKPVQYESWSPQPTAASYTLGAAGTNWAYTKGDGLVHQPTGSAWAAAISEPGPYEVPSGLYGIWSAWNSSGSVYNITKYQTGTTGTLGFNNSDALDILFLDVTGFPTTF